jgi:NADPH:quinone reductase-like Zn-dependent oxidoreductase/short-subunit dehydrogenase/acyl carrier protein
VGRELGGECAGRITAVGSAVVGLAIGDAVMAMAPRSFSRWVTVDARYVARRPGTLSASEGAGLPIAFLTAWYGLFDLGKLKRAERVLIHAAAGGVGLAAVQLALNVGAEVLATASPSKWPVLERMGVKHLASSRTVDFGEQFHRATGGEGIDVVLNSLTGEFIETSLELLRAGGRFIELGKRDVRDAATVGVESGGITYQAFDTAEVAPPRIAEMFEEIVSGMESGALRPLPVETFPITRAEAAFRFMSQAKHVGKVVLLPCRRSPRIRGDVSYLITGGLGALGLRVAERLVERGARHLVLMGRSGPSEQAREAIAKLESARAKVTVASADVTSRSELEGVLRAIPAEAPLGGVIHSVLVLDDGVLAEQTSQRFERVMSPKVVGAWNLHELTKDKSLDFFVLFSSASSLFGAAGQSNYAAANAFLDALAEERQSQGLPALSIAWGAWSGGGALARVDEANRRRLERSALSPDEGLALFERALALGRAYVSAFRLEGTLRGGDGEISPLLSELVGKPPRLRSGPSDLVAQLRKLAPAEREAALLVALRAEAAKVLGLSEVPVERPLRELGLDSLTAVELRNRIAKRIGAPLPATLAFDYPTISRQAAFVLGQVLELAPTVTKASAVSSTPGLSIEDLASLTVDETLARFEEQLNDEAADTP